MQYVWMILLFLPSALSQRFRVVGGDAPVFSVSGSEVVLSCSVREFVDQNIRKNAVDMTVTWSKSDLENSVVHLYENHEDLNTGQNPSYRGRTAVFKEELKNGNVSLKLSNVRISDEGEYTCRVDSTTWKSDKTFKLSVEAVGSEPVITVEKYESGKFSLLCESKGWRPEPELQWRNSIEVIQTAETETQPVADFFNVKSRITVEEIDSFFCTVTQRNHEKEGRITAQTLHDHVPIDPGKIVGIIIGVLLLVGVPAGVSFYFYNEKRKLEEELYEVKSLLNSNKDGSLQHQDLSPRQWDYVEFTLLKSEEEREEFILRKFDPSDRGVKKLKKVIASSKKALLKQCNLTEESCEVLASVLSSENSLTELDLSFNHLQESGVKKLCEGLKSSHCKLQILRLEDCYLTEGSCEDLASVLKLVNSKLIELNLSLNTGLKYSGVKKLCVGLKNENCKLKILWLEACNLTEGSCEDLASVLKLVNSKLIELNLSKNTGLKDSGVEKLCDGLKNNNCKLKILWLEDCYLTRKSCADLVSVLKSKNSKLTELNLSKNPGMGVIILCVGLKDENCKLETLRLDYCGLTEKSCAVLAEVLQSENSNLIELNLSHNKGLGDSGVEKLCVGLKNKHCKLQILRLDYCGLTEESCADLASVLKSVNSKLIELNLSENTGLRDSGVKKLCDGLKNEHCKLQILRLDFCFLTKESYADLASVLKSENSKLIELNLNKNELRDSGVKKLCDGLKDKNCKLQILRLAGCRIKKEGFTALASALKLNPSSPLKELDLSDNQIRESEQKLFSELKDTFPDLKVKLNEEMDLSENELEHYPSTRIYFFNTDEGCDALASENPPLPSEEQDLRDNELKETEQKLLPEPNDTFV